MMRLRYFWFVAAAVALSSPLFAQQTPRPPMPILNRQLIGRTNPNQPNNNNNNAAATTPAERPPLPKRIGEKLPPAMKPQGEKPDDFANLSVRDGMVRISAGKAEGENPDDDLSGYVLMVREPFHMDRTEVTWKLWKEVRDWAVQRPDMPESQRENFKYDIANAGEGKGDDHPVQRVSWFECIKWCNARSEKDGLTPCYTVSGTVFRKGDGIPEWEQSATGYRLPTVQEWEYAARGGYSDRRFPWGDEITHENANYFSVEGPEYDKSESRGINPKAKTGKAPFTCPVASFAPNGYGLYDMAGNVWEWCWANKGASRYVCGGSWDADSAGLRCGARTVCDGTNDRADFGGFRTVRKAGQ